MMNSSKAIKFLYHVGNLEVVQLFGGNSDKLERELELEHMARHKSKFRVSMQRSSKFSEEEHETAESSLRSYYPDLDTAFLDQEAPKKEDGEPCLFSALIDGHPEFDPDAGKHRSAVPHRSSWQPHLW